MQKNIYRYEQTAARLIVEGYPDLSSGHKEDVIGILSRWSLELVSAPELEGSREHLEAIMEVVMPYVRYFLSGINRTFISKKGFVTISKELSGHSLILKSSKEKVEPLTLFLDDADLSDLVRCLDRLRLDPNVKLTWKYDHEMPLSRKDIFKSVPLTYRLTAPLLGGFALLLSIVFSYLIPIPPPQNFQIEDSSIQIQ